MDLTVIAVVLGTLLMLQYVPMMSESLAPDGLALLDFKDGLTVTSPLLANWKASDTSPCSWSGVSCSQSGDVQNVTLPAQVPMLEGNISSSLGKLKYLQELMLSNNLLTGSIPRELGKLSRLKVLDLTSNKLSGVIPPQLGNCSSLVTLWLAGNTLSGAFPESLGHLRNLSSVLVGENLPNHMDTGMHAFEIQNSISGSVPMGIFENPNLVSFDVSNNNLGGDITSALEEMSKRRNIELISIQQNHFIGMLPPSIGNATTLLLLHLLQQSDRFMESGGGFGGRVPKEVGKLVNLDSFYICCNNFFGEIPNEIGKMTSLTALDFSFNNMNGTIPSSLGNLVNLRALYLSDNHFSGPIPMSFGSLTKLNLFFVENNQFFGSIPKDFGRFMSNLSEIDFSHNFFHGQLPSGLCQGNQLQRMNFGSNQLQGAIPSSFVRCTSFTHVYIGNNQFTSIPDGFGSNSSLQWLDASNNQFFGILPSNLGVNSQLYHLKLNNNKFTGDISRLEFSKLAHNLTKLNLANNNFTGQIPTTMAMCKFLYEVDLSSNSLIGNVPLEFKNLSRLKTLNIQKNNLTFINPSIFSSWANVIHTLDISSNPWNKSIPSEIGSLILLENLNLSYGGFRGIIPLEFGMLTKLEVLDLSHNNLIGEVPKVLGELMVSLDFIDISFNNLTGSLPPEWMKFFHTNPKSFIGNPNLCLESNASTRHCTKLSSIGNPQNKTKLSIVVILVVSLGIFLILIILATIFFSQRYMSMKKTTNVQLLNDVFIQNLTKDALPFTFEEIMAITDNLSDAYIIGHGGHGVVYKVASTIGHKTIVVKKIESLDITTLLIHKSFWREVETVGNTKHRNLVRLLGFMKWSKVGLLLYDYIPNGDLYTVLHKRESQGIDLPWRIRLCIAEGVATGLAYLHHEYGTPIIHRDIKSSNVLLDNNLEAHISDFGLAKVLETQSGTQECLSMSTISGTYGYIAPEVGYGTLVTPKLDVYSFGILLLELLTGRQPINRNLGETWHIDAWVRASVLENEGRMNNSVLDPLLINTTSLATIEEMLFVQRIALHCTTFNPCDRPTMRDVVNLLKSLSKKIVKSIEEESIEVA